MRLNEKIKYVPGNRAGIKENKEKEGIIEVRPGIRGLSLGKKNYVMAYVRVLDEQHYFKGMCIYSDNLPEDYDVICYYSDPAHGLKILKSVTSEIKLNKDIITKIESDMKI